MNTALLLSGPLSGPLPPLTLILGGARSGKSRLAEALAEKTPSPLYLATARPGDEEMTLRIKDHKNRRPPHWRTIEEPLEAATAINPDPPASAIVLDCLTLWLANILADNRDPATETARLLNALQQASAPVILVSNEIGLGLVPVGADSRAFRDLAGRLNQDMAQAAQSVIFVAAGLPLILKEPS